MKRAVVVLVATIALLGQDLAGVVDIHAHADPDSLPRAIDALELARLARQRGLRGLVVKNHYEPTASLAWLARKEAPGLEVFGGIALNLSVGGVNPAAVERMTRVRGGLGRVVWMPTFDAEHHVRAAGEPRPFVSVARDGKLLPEVLEVLALVARHGLVLATGHSSPTEALLLVAEARRRGVERIVVTHAMLAPVTMSIPQMQRAAAAGAYIEFVGNALLGPHRSLTPRQYAEAIRAVGPEHCILSSDLGQAGNPLHPDGLETLFGLLRHEGLSVEEIEQMAKRNPARLLGLP
ncbi:MAG: DUF6282 family protein [Bryobacterales bacterium]|nr:amidohydrolase [Bryobacteraceae bacterium]MDW8355401.1 DUF6282 family protein [Bryobacterales bacterium]